MDMPMPPSNHDAKSSALGDSRATRWKESVCLNDLVEQNDLTNLEYSLQDYYLTVKLLL